MAAVVVEQTIAAAVDEAEETSAECILEPVDILGGQDSDYSELVGEVPILEAETVVMQLAIED